MIEVTDEAITQILKLQEEKQFDYIRLGVQPAGCAGFEYVFSDTSSIDISDVVLDYGKFSFLISKESVEYIIVFREPLITSVLFPSTCIFQFPLM